MSWVIAIDIGATSVSGGLVSAEGEIRFKRSINTQDTTHKHPLIPRLLDLARKIKGKAAGHGIEVLGIGIGSPGIVDSKKGVVIAAGNIPELFGAHLGDRIGEPLSLPVQVENDVNAMAIGEMVFGVAKGQKNFILLALGTDLGGGIIIDGKLLRGMNNIASEFGHITQELKGSQCVCGGQGCAREWVSGKGLADVGNTHLPKDSLAFRLAKEQGAELSSYHIFRAAEQGDEPAKELLEEFYRRFGAVVATVMKVLDPEVVVLGGQVCSKEPQMITEVVRWTRHYYFPLPELPEFRLSEFTKETAVLGPAAAFFIEHGVLK